MSTVSTALKVNSELLIKCLQSAFEIQQPCMVWGPPGIGKSDIIFLMGQLMNRPVIDVRLAMWDPTDLKGLPYLDKENGVMLWAPSGELPSDPNSWAILFLDELPSAPPSVQNAAYQLILNRRIGQYVLPKNVLIVAAGNREGDRGHVHRMLAPLASRFTHYELASNDFEGFLKWGIEHDLEGDLLGFLMCNKSLLFNFDPNSSSYTFMCPRTWSFADKFLKQNKKNPDPKVLEANLYGSVGDAGAAALLAHMQYKDVLPDPKEVITGKHKEALRTTEVAAMWSLLINLCQELKYIEKNGKPSDKVWREYIDNFLRYVMDNFIPEMIVMSARLVLMKYDIDIDTESESFGEFYDKYASKYITNT